MNQALEIWNIGQVEKFLVYQAKQSNLQFIESLELAAWHVVNLRGNLEYGENWLPYLQNFDYSLIFLPNQTAEISSRTIVG